MKKNKNTRIFGFKLKIQAIIAFTFCRSYIQFLGDSLREKNKEIENLKKRIKYLTWKY